jgi:hypothetical protein
MMAQVTMTMEEYLALVNGLSGNVDPAPAEVPVAQDKPKRRSKKNPKLKRALIEANRRMRLKSGKLRKGKTQADVMRLAHKLLKKM